MKTFIVYGIAPKRSLGMSLASRRCSRCENDCYDQFQVPQRKVFRRRDVRQQSRSFARWN